MTQNIDYYKIKIYIYYEHTFTHTMLYMYNHVEGGVHLHGNIPVVLNVLVDHAGDHHSNDCVVPRGYKHEGQTDSHPQK